MRLPATPFEIRERIWAADEKMPDAEVAASVGVAERTVRKYRKQLRTMREEAARETIARHVEENVPDALSDLTELRQMARKHYERDGDARQGRLWLGAIKTTLEHVTPDNDDLDRAIAAALADLADPAPQGAPGPAGGAARGAAVH